MDSNGKYNRCVAHVLDKGKFFPEVRSGHVFTTFENIATVSFFTIRFVKWIHFVSYVLPSQPCQLHLQCCCVAEYFIMRKPSLSFSLLLRSTVVLVVLWSPTAMVPAFGQQNASIVTSAPAQAPTSGITVVGTHNATGNDDDSKADGRFSVGSGINVRSGFHISSGSMVVPSLVAVAAVASAALLMAA